LRKKNITVLNRKGSELKQKKKRDRGSRLKRRLKDRDKKLKKKLRG
jgi:hypothetical protein